MFSTQANQNKVSVTEAFIDNIVANADKYRCIPLCADTRKLKSGDHKHLGHMLDKTTGVFLTEQIGAFACFEKVNDEYGASLIGEARIAKRNKRVCGAILELFDAGGLNFSFEIMAGDVAEQDGLTVIDVSESNELIGMAVVSLPAYPEAKALALVAEITLDNQEWELIKHAVMQIAEVDFDTIRFWFFEALRGALGDSIWDYRIERVGVDCSILYSTRYGNTIKVEYVAGDEGVLITDVYEVIYQRKEEGGALSMSDATNIQATQDVLPVPESNELQTAQAEIVRKDGEIADLKRTVAALTKQVAEFDALKTEVETLRVEKADAAIQAKRAQMTLFARASNLDLAGDAVAAAIENADYEALMAEALKAASQAKPAPAAALTLSAAIQPKEYGGLLESE
jgi:hypothetical protein